MTTTLTILLECSQNSFSLIYCIISLRFHVYLWALDFAYNKLLLLLSFRSVSNFDKCATRDFPLDERNRFATRETSFAFTNSAGNLENGGAPLSLSLSIHLSIFRSNTRIAFSVKPQPTAATRVSFRAFELLTVINRPDIIRPPLRFIKVSHRDILPVERTDHDRVKGKLKGIRETRKRWATTSNDDRFETVF